ncbi:MAG: helix-turn-helix domain-containing protein [Gammaproteobacteria bacterium]|nr:helix-turn-helix domain-containing protein [Gammaproteobacteria bacterium]NNF48343.1 DNA-3-methyladenine glycosylase 2 family protein [Woeseiaceae bacterium]MBT8094309.1 helix-turn-helix domain-containing protein [Gammaproteobacteria bacterium]MBT8106002.1 helix-turn-helix domain-containing protein [Gammaproteobacteria bacterium]NNK26016.1 DNA-3-methyladenine glycosylase 2 family protein [Woeseiaceae bacterium]
MDSVATIDQRVLERARVSRDPRFDGRFYVGVMTTGIYCRPICPANAPKSENVRFFPTAAAASEAGFRPCLRCRPECAPGTPAWAGTSTTVRRGLRLIADGALDEGDVEGLAARLGVTSRHLRRLFVRHVGASPLAVAHTQRLQFAKRLIDETTLPMKDISVAAGFGSVRRFNDTFRRVYGKTPRELRRGGDTARASDAFSLMLPYRRPYDWDRLLGFFAARAIPGVEQVTGGRYRRGVRYGDGCGIIEIHDAGGALSLAVHGLQTESLLALVQRVRGMFDVDAPIDEFGPVLRRDGRLRAWLRDNPGVRVPGAWDGWELAVRAVLGQQVSVAAATTFAGRIAERYGVAFSVDGLDQGPGRLFPTPRALARARLEHLGIIRSRAQTIRDLARAVDRGDVSFDAAQVPEEFCAAFSAIRGIGDWTSEYVAMRVLKNPDAFPASDLGLLRAFDASAGRRLRPRELLERAENWRPWRAYAALLTWGSDTGAGG